MDWTVITGQDEGTAMNLYWISVVITIILSLLLVFTYDMTTIPQERPPGFVPALLLMSIVTSTIMQSIGDSLALSFGVFGALAMIRFRSLFTNMRDVSFIFATMAIGIASGVHAFLNGIIGTLSFCTLVFILQLTPFTSRKSLKGSAVFQVVDDVDVKKVIFPKLKPHARFIRIANYQVRFRKDQSIVHEYEISFTVYDLFGGKKIQEEFAKIPEIIIRRVTLGNLEQSNN